MLFVNSVNINLSTSVHIARHATMIVLNLLLKRKEGDRVLNYSSTYHECNLCTCRPACKTGVFNPILKVQGGRPEMNFKQHISRMQPFFDFFFRFLWMQP